MWTALLNIVPAWRKPPGTRPASRKDADMLTLSGPVKPIHKSVFWRQRLKADGYPIDGLLRLYINSPYWWMTREAYKKSELPQRCLICNSIKYQLHHTIYNRLGREHLWTLRPLCANHHKALHQTLNRYNIPLAQTDEALSIIANNFNIQDWTERLKPFSVSEISCQSFDEKLQEAMYGSSD